MKHGMRLVATDIKQINYHTELLQQLKIQVFYK